MLWVKVFHIIAVISWFAGLFYLPRIFVNLAMVPAGSVAERERLVLMATKLYRFVTPIGALAVGLGFYLWLHFGFSGGWLHAKTSLVMLLVVYHFTCCANSSLVVTNAAMFGSAFSMKSRSCCWSSLLFSSW
jgi:putative membrane protein